MKSWNLYDFVVCPFDQQFSIAIQVDHLQSLLSPTRAAPLATSDMHISAAAKSSTLPALPICFNPTHPGIERFQSRIGASPGLSTSEDESGSKRQRY